ncbi:MAG TPA: hypothetical protein VHO24_01585, partial [Opitutaceae bacterium]|nr:hypothetical protein [Opitutaceae bacterium]
MNAASPVREINRLHSEVVRHADDSKKCLHAAMLAAWQAGQLLLEQQKQVRRTMGAAWGQWLDEKFEGSRRTAQNYMRLAESVANPAEFRGMSLRQVYLRLGIATEPKNRAASPPLSPLPSHIRLAGRLLATLKPLEETSGKDIEQNAVLKQDLRALYECLRRVFEPDYFAPERQ